MPASANGLALTWRERLAQLSRSLFGSADFPALTALALRTYTRFAGAVRFRPPMMPWHRGSSLGSA